MSNALAALTATAALILPACGSSSAPGTKESPAPTHSITAPSSTVKPEPIVGPARVSGNDLTVSVHVTWFGCEQKPTLAAAETPTLVQLRLATVDRSGPGVVCPQIARIGWASVTLGHPLGNRPIEDASTGALVGHSAPSGTPPTDP
jgi:hypothetical protein